jgi:hypothetical protein
LVLADNAVGTSVHPQFIHHFPDISFLLSCFKVCDFDTYTI